MSQELYSLGPSSDLGRSSARAVRGTPGLKQVALTWPSSGHFLCGVSRRSSRSIIATFTFFSIALLTANLVPPPPMPTSLASRLASSLKKPQPKDLPIMLIPALAVANIVIRQLLEAPNQKAKQNPAAIPPLPLRLAPYFLAGVTFSLGLLVSGMADPQKVLGFLLPTHADRFDPSMLMVVLGGVIPNAIHWALMSKGKPQLAWEKWSVPNRTLVDWRLLAGAVVFGMGWGLAGVCPGPVMVGVGRVLLGLSKGEPLGGVANPVFGFTMAMFAGMGLAGFV